MLLPSSFFLTFTFPSTLFPILFPQTLGLHIILNVVAKLVHKAMAHRRSYSSLFGSQTGLEAHGSCHSTYVNG
jgi:hypothetical protein